MSDYQELDSTTSKLRTIIEEAAKRWGERMEDWRQLWPIHIALTDDQLVRLLARRAAFTPESARLNDTVTSWLDQNAAPWDYLGEHVGFKDENAAFAFRMRWC